MDVFQCVCVSVCVCVCVCLWCVCSISVYLYVGLHVCVCVLSTLNASHCWVDEGEVVEHGLIHAVDEGAVCTGQTGLLVDELFVKVTAVTRTFLHHTPKKERERSQHTQSHTHTHVRTHSHTHTQEVSCDWLSHHCGPKGRLHLPLLHGDPVSVSEEGVRADVPSHPQPPLRLPHKQLQPITGHRHGQLTSPTATHSTGNTHADRKSVV